MVEPEHLGKELEMQIEMVPGYCLEDWSANRENHEERSSFHICSSLVGFAEVQARQALHLMIRNKNHHQSLIVQMRMKFLKHQTAGIRASTEMKICEPWPLELGFPELESSSRC